MTSQYRDGLMLFGEADEHLLPDLLHPNGEGYELMGQYATPFIESDLGSHFY